MGICRLYQSAVQPTTDQLNEIHFHLIVISFMADYVHVFINTHINIHIHTYIHSHNSFVGIENCRNLAQIFATAN